MCSFCGKLFYFKFEMNDDKQGWIKWFCNLEDHHFFCEIDEFFIADPFNLYGLKQQFDHFE